MGNGRRRKTKKKESRNEKWRTDKIVFTKQEYIKEEFTRKELTEIIKNIKRRKAPGPDETPMEIFKEMDEDNKEEVRNILNDWWREEKYRTNN